MDNKNDIKSIIRVYFLKRHPSSCASLAEILSILFFSEIGLNLDAKNPKKLGNDLLVLSKGHAAPILCVLIKKILRGMKKDILVKKI